MEGHGAYANEALKTHISPRTEDGCMSSGKASSPCLVGHEQVHLDPERVPFVGGQGKVIPSPSWLISFS